VKSDEDETNNEEHETEKENGQLTNPDAHVSPSEARIWNNLANIKFKALNAGWIELQET
jgi:hypothetical protein